MKTKFKVALAQVAPKFGDVSFNINKHLEWIFKAKEKGADIVVFPELALTGYSLKDMSSEIAIRPDGKGLEPIRRASKDIGIVVSFPELGDDFIPYISMGFFYGGELVHLYRKVHPPTHGMFEELKFFGVGNSIRAFDTPWVRMGMMVCRDIWHPELAFVLSADNATFMVASSAIPARNLSAGGFGVQDSMKRTVQNTALTNQSWVVMCNRVGIEDGVSFLGGSLVCSPSGKIVKELPILEEALEIVEIDLEQLRRDRDSLNLVRERRLDLISREINRIKNND
jgi:NAD+ synthase (glutamine-hydrolysing)